MLDVGSIMPRFVLVEIGCRTHIHRISLNSFDMRRFYLIIPSPLLLSGYPEIL